MEQGRILTHPALAETAKRHNATPAQAALAWVLRKPGILAIPKASTEAHVRENAKALSLTLTSEDLAALDTAFPAPKRKTPLEML